MHFLHSCILSHTVTYLGSHKGGQFEAKGGPNGGQMGPKGGQMGAKGGKRGPKLSRPLVTMLLCRGATCHIRKK